MYKFRSMVADAEKLQAEVSEVTEDGKIIFKKEDDPRITRVGRFLRHTSLDELPQLINVVKGDMSLVGPRPELPSSSDNTNPGSTSALRYLKA
ncbi:MAG: sugar transferase [Chloroflexota bacterium]